MPIRNWERCIVRKISCILAACRNNSVAISSKREAAVSSFLDTLITINYKRTKDPRGQPVGANSYHRRPIYRVLHTLFTSDHYFSHSRNITYKSTVQLAPARTHGKYSNLHSAAHATVAFQKSLIPYKSDAPSRRPEYTQTAPAEKA